MLKRKNLRLLIQMPPDMQSHGGPLGKRHATDVTLERLLSGVCPQMRLYLAWILIHAAAILTLMHHRLLPIMRACRIHVDALK